MNRKGPQVGKVNEHIVDHVRTPNGPLAIDAQMQVRIRERARTEGESYADVLVMVSDIYEECGSDHATATREVDAYLDRLRGSRWNPIE